MLLRSVRSSELKRRHFLRNISPQFLLSKIKLAHLAACVFWFLAWLIFRPWRSRRYIPPKLLALSELQSAATQNAAVLILWGVVSAQPFPCLEVHLLSTDLHCLLNIFRIVLHVWKPSPPSATWGRAMTLWQWAHLKRKLLEGLYIYIYICRPSKSFRLYIYIPGDPFQFVTNEIVFISLWI
jgi:hypothetical protein